jgi:hypothetical protein
LPRLREDLCVAILLGISAFAVFGCGGGGGTPSTGTRAAAKPSRSAGPRATTAGRCRLGPFLHALDTLEGRLAAGLSYEQYFEEVKGAKSAYEAVPVGKLELPCLTALGTPGEKALNQYIEAANVWRACRADAGCGTYTIEPGLQRRWRVASHYIAVAHEGGA